MQYRVSTWTAGVGTLLAKLDFIPGKMNFLYLDGMHFILRKLKRFLSGELIFLYQGTYYTWTASSTVSNIGEKMKTSLASFSEALLPTKPVMPCT